jgi:ABC-type glycerol-3-phosphate transport system substrate-binding protein
MRTATGLSRRRLLGVAAATTPLVAAACGATATVDTTNPDAVRGKIVHWSNANFPFSEDIGAEFVKEFKAKYPNIQYETDLIVGDRFEKMVASAAAGTMPDIGMSTPYQVQEQGLKGIARAHDDFLKTSKVVKQADLWPSLTYDLIYKGKQYAMPFAPDVRVMYINDAVMQGAGLDPAKPAKDWDEVEDHVRRIYRGGEGKLGFPPFWGSGGNALWLLPFWQLGGETIDKEGVKITIDNENGIKALEWLKKLYDLQGGWNSVADRMKVAQTPNTHFVQGNMGYYFATFTERKSNEFRGSPTLKFNFTPWPIPKGGRRVNYGGNHCYFLTTGSKTPEVAWKFLEFLNQDDIILRFTERYDRIPVKIKVAESQAYQKNDPFLKLAVEEMRVRKFQVPAPGGGEIQALHNKLGMEAASGQRPVREILKDYQAQMQLSLDKFKGM